MVDLDRLMHEDPANARILAWLGTGERDRLGPFHGLGFDQGGVDLLLRYGRDLPDACKWSLDVANVKVHPVTGVIFAVHYGRYTFLVRRPGAPHGRPPFAETLDGTVDLRGLEDEWCSWSFEDDDEIAELHVAYAHAGRSAQTNAADPGSQDQPVEERQEP